MDKSGATFSQIMQCLPWQFKLFVTLYFSIQVTIELIYICLTWEYLDQFEQLYQDSTHDNTPPSQNQNSTSCTSPPSQNKKNEI